MADPIADRGCCSGRYLEGLSGRSGWRVPSGCSTAHVRPLQGFHGSITDPDNHTRRVIHSQNSCHAPDWCPGSRRPFSTSKEEKYSRNWFARMARSANRSNCCSLILFSISPRSHNRSYNCFAATRSTGEAPPWPVPPLCPKDWCDSENPGTCATPRRCGDGACGPPAPDAGCLSLSLGFTANPLSPRICGSSASAFVSATKTEFLKAPVGAIPVRVRSRAHADGPQKMYNGR